MPPRAPGDWPAAAAAALGYDPRTPAGRTRYVLARTLQRLRNAPPL